MGRLLLKLLNSYLFITTIIFLSNINYASNVSDGFRLPDYIIPEHYNIHLDLTHFEKDEGNLFKNISGTCNVNIEVIRPTEYISLHAKKPQIEIHHVTLHNTAEFFKPINTTYNKETHILVFHFHELFGYYTLKMSFNSFADDSSSFLRIAYANSQKNKA